MENQIKQYRVKYHKLITKIIIGDKELHYLALLLSANVDDLKVIAIDGSCKKRLLLFLISMFKLTKNFITSYTFLEKCVIIYVVFFNNKKYVTNYL